MGLVFNLRVWRHGPPPFFFENSTISNPGIDRLPRVQVKGSCREVRRVAAARITSILSLISTECPVKRNIPVQDTVLAPRCQALENYTPFGGAQTPLDSGILLGCPRSSSLTNDLPPPPVRPPKSLIDKKVLHELLAYQPSMFP